MQDVTHRIDSLYRIDRIDYKLSTICHSQPPFLDYCSDLLTVYTPSWQLRSSADTRILRILHVRSKISGQSCFSFRSYVEVEVAVLDSPSLIVPTVSVDVKQHWTWTIFPTGLHSNGFLSFLTSSTFSPSMPSNLHKRLASKALRTKPQRFKILSFRPLCFYQDLAHEYARVRVGPWIG